MTASELVSALHARGVRLAVRGKALDFEAPAGALEPADVEALRAAKADILALLRERQTPEALPPVERVSLWRLDRVIEVATPWSDTPLILAPGCRVAENLRTTDPKPGRVWCTCEVLDLLLSGVSPLDARKIAEMRTGFAATLAGMTTGSGR